MKSLFNHFEVLEDYRDIKMASNNKREAALKIEFLEEKINEFSPYFEKQYDIICTDDTGYDEISKITLIKIDCFAI